MAKIKFKLNRAGVGSLLKGAEMQSVLEGHGASMKGRLGDGYEAKSFVGFDRAHVIVKTASAEARRENSNNNSILKAVR